MHLGNQSQTASTHIMQALREYKLGNKSRYWPFIKSWPKPGEVVAGCCMDDKYDAMWKAPYWEAHHQGWRERLVSLWHDSTQHLGATVKEALGKDVEVTLEDVKYAAAITLTRFLSLPGSRGAMIMAPIFDLANHDRHCANTLEDFTADFLYLIAGRDYEPGEEICYSYGDLRDDVAVSGYGFLPALEDPPRLAYVDHWQFEGLRDWHGIDTEDDFDGTPEELQAEMRRLEGIRADILSMPDLVPKPEGDDYVWNMMKELEARRIAAIDYEVTRLKELLAGDEHEEL
ncbi:hypothetical protein HYH03_003549 [Edaphochlamys debaryana]|uniref:SET domain-containing protein n=1 Tax=Edaphochlamys debaryana TaxID=47281 RepID=A0A835Y929_9CHLO|nr:hypothetical protein HYH03_003549 [Edaphochlamys debaryana]|eukprot:KAG2498288.1 hypothetical protein HYH03_003549 [Edaphochlamys debaryana]